MNTPLNGTKCMVSIFNQPMRKNIPAFFLGLAPRLSETQVHIISGDSTKRMATVDALVLLESFDKGAIYQLPLDMVRLCDEWDRIE